MYCNEIELCEVADTACRQQIDKALTKEHISFYFKWYKPISLKPWAQFLKSGAEVFTVCVNENDKEKAEALIRAICDELGCKVKFTFKKIKRSWRNYE